MRVAAVDTVAAIAMLTPEHVFSADALDAVAQSQSLVMHTVNLAEFLAGLSPSQWPEVKADLTDCDFSFHDTFAETLAQARRETRLKMPDACVIAVARETGADGVITFDERLRTTAAALGFTVNPPPTTPRESDSTAPE
jgi:predicted nucleic acid-binding protein